MTEILEVKDWFPVVTRSSDDLMILGYVKESTEILQIGVISGLNESVIQDQDDQLYHLITEPKYLPLDSQDTEFFYPVNRAKFQEFLNRKIVKNYLFLWDPCDSNDILSSLCCWCFCEFTLLAAMRDFMPFSFSKYDLRSV